MTLPPRETYGRIRRLHAMVGSEFDNESDTARQKLRQLLREHGCSWNDLDDIFSSMAADTSDDADTPSDVDESLEAEAAEWQVRGVNVFDKVLDLCERYIWIGSKHERVAIVLCVLNAWVFDKFEHCPRMAVLAPGPACGKSRLLKKFVRSLLKRSFYSADTTAASLYSHLERDPGCPLIVDEADNLEIEGSLLTLFNEGYEYGGTISRCLKTYNVYGPLFLGGIGSTLPGPLMQRSVAIYMRRPPPDAIIQTLNLNKLPREFAVTKALIGKFAANCFLDDQPDLPLELCNHRHADKWLPLISIADALGRGDLAREAALALDQRRVDEDPISKLLTDIRDVFDDLRSSPYGANRISVSDLCEALSRREDGCWLAWCGVDGRQRPHQLTRSELLVMLRAIYPSIRPRTIWPSGPREGAKSCSGYDRKQFEDAWAMYCSTGGAARRSRRRPRLLRQI
jgi:hypothetical protein